MKKLMILAIGIALVLQAFSQEKSKMTKVKEKMHNPKYALFYDNHTMPAIKLNASGFVLRITFKNV